MNDLILTLTFPMREGQVMSEQGKQDLVAFVAEALDEHLSERSTEGHLTCAEHLGLSVSPVTVHCETIFAEVDI